MPLTKGAKAAPAATESKEDVKEKVQAAVQAESVVESTDGKEYGKLADKLAFVCCLGDPSKDDVIYEKDASGKAKVKRVDPTIVGYRFKAEVDLEVPDVKPGDDFKSNLMSYTGDTTATRTVKAGTEFDLTKFETGMLISREEFNGRALGGAIKVSCSYQTQSKKTSSGAIATTKGATVPGIALRAIEGSIKDVPIVPVLKFTTTTVTTDNGKQMPRKERQIIEGFEKWEPLCKARVVTGGRSSSGSASNVNKRNDLAAQFLQIAQAKAAK